MKPLADHGTTARAYGSPGYRPPCHCEPCTTAKRKAWKRARVNRQLGRGAFVDPAPAAAHLRTLNQTMTWQQIEAATGVNESNLFLIVGGHRTKIRRTTHDKIMAARQAGQAARGQFVDATGSMRRIRALATLGYGLRAIADAAGSARIRIHHISTGEQPTVRRDLAERIAAAYKQLAYRPVPDNRFTVRTRNAAAAKGWHGPLAWDDIDDPDAKPELSRKSTAKNGARRRVQADPAVVARLTDLGKSADQIAMELGCHKRTVVRARNRIRTEQIFGTAA